MIGLAFAFPLLLWGLLALPVLWFLLRAVPPAPIRRRFPGVALLLGLRDQDRQAEKTPWWLMALRMAAIALVIVGFAGPVLNPKPVVISDKPLLILFDGGWAEAPDWSARLDHATALLEEAGRSGRLRRARRRVRAAFGVGEPAVPERTLRHARRAGHRDAVRSSA